MLIQQIKMIGSTNERGTITLGFIDEISWNIRFTKHDNTCWYSLKDIGRLLEVKDSTSVVASHITVKNKKMFSFGARPGYIINLDGIFELRTAMNVSKVDFVLAEILLEFVEKHFKTDQEVEAVRKQQEQKLTHVTQEDILAFEVLNATSTEEKLLAVTSYKMYLAE